MMDTPYQVSTGSGWSKLSSNLMNKVFKCLGFAEQANSACPSRLCASRQSTPNNQNPWLILFPEKGKDYCLLLNPQEKEKVSRIQDLGDNFANSHCLAICGSWLYMRDPRSNLYIMNLLTREKIDLLSVESQFGRIKIERTIDDMFRIKIDGGYIGDPHKHIDIYHPSLWIDEKTKDYVVIWSIRYSRFGYLVYSRKEDNLGKLVKSCKLDTIVFYKMNSSNTKWEKLTCLGDEAILFDQRITVRASTTKGINKNSIYFSGYRFDHRDWSEKDILIFNLDTNEVERPHQAICSSIQSSNARWFVPSFKQT